MAEPTSPPLPESPALEGQGLRTDPQLGAGLLADASSEASPAETEATLAVPLSMGHEVHAAPTNPAIEAAVLVAIVVIVAAVLGVLARYRRRIAELLTQVEFSARTVAPPAIGLAVAVMLFPDTADRLGLASYQGTRASLQVLPAALDAGLRCATSSDTLEEDGCTTHGALAVPRYLAEGAVLVMSEMRLARPGLTPATDDVQPGLRRAEQERRWGLIHAPNTARAYGREGGRVKANNPLQLSSLVLFISTLLLAAWGAFSLHGVMAEVVETAEELTAEIREVRSARIKNISVIGVLIVGAYLSFAALTALGPFLQAQKLAASADYRSAEDRISEVETEWRTARTGASIGEDTDLDRLEEALPHFAALRQELMQRSFDRLAIDYSEFEEEFDGAWRGINAYAESSRSLQEQLEQNGWEYDRRGAQELLRDAQQARAAVVDAFDMAQTVRALEAPPEPRDAAALSNDFRSRSARLESQVAALSPSGAEHYGEARRRLMQQVETVNTALRQYRSRYELALEDHRAAETTAQTEYAELVGSLGQLREHRQLMRQALLKLDRSLGRKRLEARRLLSSEQAQFSAVQRAGPGWLDRMQSLAAWFEESFQQANEQAMVCADEVAGRAAQERIEILRTVALLPRQTRQRRSVELASLQTALDAFRSDLQAIPTRHELRLIPECVTASASLAEPPDPIETKVAYGAAMSILSGWLLHSGSMDVVLLAGMLGFGLLGSGLSRIVRRQLTDDRETKKNRPWLPSQPGHQPLVDNVPAVVFQGLGATLVVYLAGVGGIGAITVEAPTLDPHVLMLGCFTASVFSEDVWKAAQQWIQARGLRD